MFSKAVKSVILTSLSVCLFTGCDQFLKGRSSEDEQKLDHVEVSTEEIACLKEAPKDLQLFFDDLGGPETIEKSVSCLQKSLQTFMRLTRGSQPGAYLSSEIQYFFNTFLLKENKISDEFQKEIMKFKVVVVGGSPEVVTRLELEQFSQFLGKMQGQLQKIQGKMRVTFFRGDQNTVRPEEIDQLKKDLSDLGEFILKNTKLTSSRYQWLDFVSFLTELNHFTGQSKGLTELLKWVPLANRAKLLFVGENAKLVSDADWYAAEDWLLNTFSAMLRFYYQIKDRPLSSPSEWTTLISWLDEMVQVLEQSPSMRDKKILEASAIDGLIDEVYGLELFKTVLTPELIKSSYRKALAHFIEAPAGRGDALAVSGLTDSHWRILKQEYSVWKLSQKFLIETYLNHPTLELQNLRWAATRFDLGKNVQASALERDELLRSWKDFQDLLAIQPGVIYGRNLKIHISSFIEKQPLSFTGANMINAVRSYTRLALRGYGDREAKFSFDKKITRQRLVHLEEDFRELGRAMAILDPREKDSASRTFDQGNFFTYHGDGDSYLDARETYEVLSMLISGGRTQVNELFHDLEARRCMLSERDVFNKNYVNENCFIQALRENYKTYFDNLPGMVQFFSGLNEAEFEKTYKALMYIAAVPGKEQNGRVEFAEIRNLQCVLNFIESLMAVYDKDRNSLLSEAEVEAAAPRFKSFIIKEIGERHPIAGKFSLVGEALHENVFMFMVFYGKVPEAGKGDLYKIGIARNSPFKDLGSVNRQHLIQLLSVLKNEI